MLFQPFQPGLRLVEKVDDQTNRKRFPPIELTKTPNQLNRPETVDANGTRPKCQGTGTMFVILEASLSRSIPTSFPGSLFLLLQCGGGGGGGGGEGVEERLWERGRRELSLYLAPTVKLSMLPVCLH